MKEVIVSTFSLWLIVEDSRNGEIKNCMTSLNVNYGPSPIFEPHITCLYAIPDDNTADDILKIVKEEVSKIQENAALQKEENKHIRFKDIRFEKGTWSQNLFLVAQQPNLFLDMLNESLMRRYGMTPGFQAPCKVPHMSLMYVEEEEEEMQRKKKAFIESDFSSLFDTDFRMKNLELWKTKGGFKGIENWEKVWSLDIGNNKECMN